MKPSSLIPKMNLCDSTFEQMKGDRTLCLIYCLFRSINFPALLTLFAVASNGLTRLLASHSRRRINYVERISFQHQVNLKVVLHMYPRRELE